MKKARSFPAKKVVISLLLAVLAVLLYRFVLHPSAEHLYILDITTGSGGSGVYAGSNLDEPPSYYISDAEKYLRNKWLLPVKLDSLERGDKITVISNGQVLATGPYTYVTIYCIFVE